MSEQYVIAAFFGVVVFSGAFFWMLYMSLSMGKLLVEVRSVNDKFNRHLSWTQAIEDEIKSVKSTVSEHGVRLALVESRGESS